MDIKRFGLYLVIAFLVLCIGLVGFAGKTHAAFIFHSGFETGDFSEWAGVTGSPSIDETTKKTGGYSIRCNTSEAVAYVDKGLTGRRISVWVYVADGYGNFTVLIGDTDGINVRLRELVGAVDLRLFDKTNYLEGVLGVFSTGSWHRISVSFDAPNDNVKVYVDGVEKISEEGTATDSTYIAGKVGGQEAHTWDIYFDDFALDDTDSTDGLGDIRVLRAVPIADAFHDDWKDTGDAAQTWDDVDEVPTTGTDDYAWVETDGTLLQQTWTSTNMTTLEINGMTPNAISSWFYYETAAGGALEYYTYMRDNGTDYSTGIDDPTDPTWVNRYDAVMPNGGGAWIEARVDAYEIGMASDDARKDIWCYTAYKMIAYTYSAVGADISNTPDSENLGTVLANTTYYAYGSAPSNPVQDGECTFTVTNNSGANVDITVEADNFTGGVGWALTSGAPGENTVKMIAYYSGQDPASGVTLTTSPQAFISGLADNASKLWDFSLQLGSFTDGAEKTSIITLSATLS